MSSDARASERARERGRERVREDDGDDRERRERRGGERGGQGMGDARGEVDRILRGVVERGGGAIDVRDAVGGRIERVEAGATGGTSASADIRPGRGTREDDFGVRTRDERDGATAHPGGDAALAVRFGSARGDERWIGSTRKGGSCVGETSADARVQSKGG